MLSLHSCCWGKSQLYPIYPLVEGQIPAESPLILDLGHPIAENRKKKSDKYTLTIPYIYRCITYLVWGRLFRWGCHAALCEGCGSNAKKFFVRLQFYVFIVGMGGFSVRSEFPQMGLYWSLFYSKLPFYAWGCYHYWNPMWFNGGGNN